MKTKLIKAFFITILLVTVINGLSSVPAASDEFKIYDEAKNLDGLYKCDGMYLKISGDNVTQWGADLVTFSPIENSTKTKDYFWTFNDGSGFFNIRKTNRGVIVFLSNKSYNFEAVK